MNNKFDPKALDSAIKNSGGKIDRETLNNAIKSGDGSHLLNNLSNKDKEKLNRILSDKAALQNILKSPLAAELIKKFGGGKNG